MEDFIDTGYFITNSKPKCKNLLNNEAGLLVAVKRPQMKGDVSFELPVHGVLLNMSP